MRAKQLHTFRRKTKSSYVCSCKENIKKPGSRAVFRTMSNIYDGAFLRKHGMLGKHDMLNKNVHFLNMDLSEDTPT